MVLTETKIKRWGNSLAIVIPKGHAKEIGLNEGEEVSVDLVKKEKIDAFGICKGAKPFHREHNILER